VALTPLAALIQRLFLLRAGRHGPLTRQGEHTVLEREFHFFRIDARDVDVELEAVGVFVHVNRRHPGGRGGAAVVLIHVAKQTIDLFLQPRHQAPRVLSHQTTHGGFSYVS
jgi:hypothetical protein